MKTKVFLIFFLAISLISNIWLGIHIKDKRNIALGNITSFSNLTLAGLNGLVKLVENPQANWESPEFKAKVYEQIVEAELAALAANQMVHLTSGTPSRVSSLMGQLSFRLQEEYVPVAVRIVSSNGAVNSQDKTTLINLVKDLRHAGWPLKHVQDLGWSKLQLSLDKFLSSEH
ncbi:hypothetical protein [Desulfolucanica intricata]|uniref:hypothetical protein n=1 Tax=Desulfolucanica intricata TaxID=1285191 RepID=UPI000831CB58|nr:hypothetical protein [Desulfolucanica intricata]